MIKKYENQIPPSKEKEIQRYEVQHNHVLVFMEDWYVTKEL